MRILLTHHFPLEADVPGRFAAELAEKLIAAGHEVQALIVDASAEGQVGFPLRRVPDAAPRFSGEVGSLTFESLTAAQLDRHLDALRRALDSEIENFNPHVVHAQHIWLLGHLALEMGVPYVLSAWQAELKACSAGTPYQRYAQEAAENAGRILISTPGLAPEIAAAFGDLDGRVDIKDGEAAWLQDNAAPVVKVYREVIDARFGNFEP